MSEENIKQMPALNEEMSRAVEALGFKELTEVQREAIPVMREGKDLVVKAPTGTGKTFAFGIPIVERVDRESDKLQAVIMAPTRELAIQINDELHHLTEYASGIRSEVVYGGDPIERQITALKRRPQILVATPGRLMDHMNRHTVKPDAVKIAVLDEADKMLDMGFFQDVSKILDRFPKDKQLCMFSATITREVMDIMWLYQRDAVEINVAPVAGSEPKITQYAMHQERGTKMTALMDLLKTQGYDRVVIFCNTKRMTERLGEYLKQKKIDAEVLSSDVNQRERSKIMDRFREHELRILVATDVAARGIDVQDIEAVINYDVPQDNTYYLHRIGRTGRAQKEGVSFVFYDTTEYGKLKEIMRYTHSDITPVKLVEGKLEKTQW